MLKKKVKDVKFTFSLNLVINNPLNQCMIIDPNCGSEKETSHFTMSLVQAYWINKSVPASPQTELTGKLMLVFLFAQYGQIIYSEMSKFRIYSRDLVLRFVYGNCSFKVRLELLFKKWVSLGVRCRRRDWHLALSFTLKEMPRRSKNSNHCD